MKSAKKKTIGILGGMGPMATVDLFKKITEMTESPNDNGHLRVIIDSNTNIPDRTEAILHGGADPLPQMISSAEILENSGAEVLIMGCNAAHYFYDKIKEHVHVPFLNMLEETAKEAKNRGFDKVVLLATDGTVESGVYHRAFNKFGIDVITPDSENQKELMDMIYKGVKAGKASWDTQNLQIALGVYRKDGAKAVVLGCTELPVAFKFYHISSPLPVLNPTRILAREAILFAGGKLTGFDDSY